jgi:hypothetical protein
MGRAKRIPPECRYSRAGYGQRFLHARVTRELRATINGALAHGHYSENDRVAATPYLAVEEEFDHFRSWAQSSLQTIQRVSGLGTAAGFCRAYCRPGANG